MNFVCETYGPNHYTFDGAPLDRLRGYRTVGKEKRTRTKASKQNERLSYIRVSSYKELITVGPRRQGQVGQVKGALTFFRKKVHPWERALLRATSKKVVNFCKEKCILAPLEKILRTPMLITVFLLVNWDRMLEEIHWMMEQYFALFNLYHFDGLRMRIRWLIQSISDMVYMWKSYRTSPDIRWSGCRRHCGWSRQFWRVRVHRGRLGATHLVDDVVEMFGKNVEVRDEYVISEWIGNDW